MADDPAGQRPGSRRLHLVSPVPTGEVPARRVALAPAPSQRALWAVELLSLLQAEVRSGVRSGVISAAEADQLLARLGLVIDQALTTR